VKDPHKHVEKTPPPKPQTVSRRRTDVAPGADTWLVTNRAGAELARVQSHDFLGAATRARWVNAVPDSEQAEGGFGLVRLTGEQEQLQFPCPGTVEQDGARFWVRRNPPGRDLPRPAEAHGR
jgi:hypothetical protein